MPDGISKAVDYFRNALNLSVEQASGIVGNLMGESNMDPNAVGDGGQAYGIAQWHPDRQANFAKLFNKSIVGSSLEEQMQFVAWELQNTEKRAFNHLLGTGTIAEATRSFMKMFERPADDSSLDNRVNHAVNASEGKGIIGTIGDKAIDAVIPQGLQDIFSGKTASRWVAVVVGIILIGLAIAAFILVRGDDLKGAVVKAVT
jgi:hypothetical protein